MKLSFARIAALFIACLCSIVHAAGIPGQGTWESTLHPRDFNNDGVADGFYDSSLNITWLANWDVLNNTRNFEDLMDPTTGIAQSLNISGIIGWRLPSALNANGSGPCEGFNCSGSEIGYMWYVELGNSTGPATNTANFTNIRTFQYWTNTRATNGFFAWKFSTEDGSQTTSATGFPKYAEFVHDGSVGVALGVPEASSWMMMVAGLGFIQVLRRRRNG